MNTHFPPSPFTGLAAVEAWDAWFRWRERGHLRDTVIEDTWLRVADALAGAESPTAGTRLHWQAQWLKALAAWRVLPDERLLAGAGTGAARWAGHALHAVLNVAAFVTDATVPEIDLRAVSECGALALRALDNAALLARAARPARVRIGIIGLADALARTGKSYASAAGRHCAVSTLQALADGCLTANVALAAERGGTDADTRAAIAHARQRGAAETLIRDARRHGLRYAHTLAITPHPRLALLANDVADTVDPLTGTRHRHVILTLDESRTLHRDGHPQPPWHAHASAPAPRETVDTLPLEAQIHMRAALEPWLDEPIAHPLRHAAAALPERAHGARPAAGNGARN